MEVRGIDFLLWVKVLGHLALMTYWTSVSKTSTCTMSEPEPHDMDGRVVTRVTVTPETSRRQRQDPTGPPLARFGTRTEGRIRKRLLFTTRCKFRSRVASSYPIHTSRAAILQAGIEN